MRRRLLAVRLGKPINYPPPAHRSDCCFAPWATRGSVDSRDTTAIPASAPSMSLIRGRQSADGGDQGGHRSEVTPDFTHRPLDRALGRIIVLLFRGDYFDDCEVFPVGDHGEVAGIVGPDARVVKARHGAGADSAKCGLPAAELPAIFVP